ncbi:exosortase/archaeosortase family protein [Nocardioides sp. TF02-7]|uniref:exosortase/archaeosortase family protein n=1 Tax=Nocardioides sp. TF02-7 TaxID=2917724 RepID=UPI001F06083E|nr:exosortase/archaeosortase family protein [Nocardioides sp. TF02-7]UMG94452.1 hypothetical protein MF408_10970 [Nocardioides sp. TF02-7]
MSAISVEPATAPWTRWPVLAVRLAIAAGLGLAAAVLWRLRMEVREVEARLADHVLRHWFDRASPLSSADGVFYVDLGDFRSIGLEVTGECTSTPVLLVILAFSIVVLLGTRIGWLRVLCAALAAAATFGVVNLARLTGIGMVTAIYDLAGYEWSHQWAGTFVTIIGAMIAAIVYLVVLGGVRGRHRKADR